MSFHAHVPNPPDAVMAPNEMTLETNVARMASSAHAGYLLVNLDFLKVLTHFPGNRILSPEMKPRNNIVY